MKQRLFLHRGNAEALTQEAPDTHDFEFSCTVTRQTTTLANSIFATPPRLRPRRSRRRHPPGAEARQSWTLRVLLPNEPVDQPPRIVSTPPLSASVDQLYVYPVLAEDADGNIARFELTQAPTGMRIDAASGLMSWTPAQPGMANVTVAVVDATGFRGEQRFVITVGSVPGLNPPEWQSPAEAPDTHDSRRSPEAPDTHDSQTKPRTPMIPDEAPKPRTPIEAPDTHDSRRTKPRTPMIPNNT